MLRRHKSTSITRATAITAAYASALGVPLENVQAEVATDNGDTVAQMRVLLSKTFCMHVNMLFCTKKQLMGVLKSADFHKRISASLRLQGMCSQLLKCVKHISRANVHVYADGAIVMVDNLNSDKMMVPVPQRAVENHTLAAIPTPSPLAISNEVARVVKIVSTSPAALAVSAAAGVLLLFILICCCRGRSSKMSTAASTRHGSRDGGKSFVQMPEYFSPEIDGTAGPRLALNDRAAAIYAYGASNMQERQALAV